MAGPASAGQVPPELAAAAALTLPTGLGGAYRSYLRSTLEIRSVFLVNAARGLLLAAAVVLIVAAGAGIRGVFYAMAAVNLISFAGVSFMLRRRIRPGLALDPATWRNLMKGALPLFVNALAMTLTLRVGHVMLMSMRGPLEVGMLGAASRVSEAFSVVPEALMITVYPLMAGLHTRPAALMRTAERSTRYLVVCTGVPVILCTVDAQQVMTLLFGPSFAPGGRLLAVLAFTALLSATGTVILNLLVATHRETALYRNTLFFSLVNIVASALLIRSHGAVGAAVALSATSALSQIALATLPATGMYVRPVLLSAARAFVAVALGILVARLSGWPPLLATGLALVVYAGALVVLGVLNRDEVRFVRTVLASARGASRP